MTATQKRRLLQGLANAIMIDARFFMRHPDRQYRVRLAYPEEVDFARAGGVISEPIPSGVRVYVGTSVAAGGRKVIGFNAEGAETNLSEEHAREAFAMLASHSDETLRNLAAHTRAAPSSTETRG